MHTTEDISEKLSELDGRLKTLENDNKQSEILDILNKLKARLLGDLNDDSPGLFSDVRELKKEARMAKEQLSVIDGHVQEIRKGQNNRIQFEKEIDDLKKEVSKIQKQVYIFTGGMVVVTWVLGYAGEIWKVIVK